MKNVTDHIFSIGIVKKNAKEAYLEIVPEYTDGLLGLDQIAHILVFYWFHENDTSEKTGLVLLDWKSWLGLEIHDETLNNFVEPEIFFQIEDKEGRELRMYTDVDRLEEEMKRVAPEDEDLIGDFIKGIRKFLPFSMSLDKAPEVMGFADKIHPLHIDEFIPNSVKIV